MNKEGKINIAKIYEGSFDGVNFCDWCDSDDNILQKEDIDFWRPIY